MKKFYYILLGTTLLFLSIFNLSTYTVNASANTSFKDDLRVVSALNVTEETGFFNESRIATFDIGTRTIVYQNNVRLMNPGGIIFTQSELIGYNRQGTSRVLAQGNVVGSGMFGPIVNFTCKITPLNLREFIRYEVRIKYHDTLWGETDSAKVVFTL